MNSIIWTVQSGASLPWLWRSPWEGSWIASACFYSGRNGGSGALQDQWEGILGGQGWPMVFGFRWCLWDVIIGCTSLSLDFLAVINIGDLIGKIPKGIIQWGISCSIRFQPNNPSHSPSPPPFFFNTSCGNSCFCSIPKNPFVLSVNILMFHRGI